MNEGEFRKGKKPLSKEGFGLLSLVRDQPPS
jgi:hypothetical protein